METESLLNFEPKELVFSIELNRQLRSSLQLFNKTSNQVAFKLLTTNPRNYGVRPRTGILSPGSDCVVTVTMRAVRQAPPNMRCKDKFMIQTVVVSLDTTPEDAQNMFNREAGHVFNECKLRVGYNFPPTEAPSFPSTEVPSLVVDNVTESSSGTSTFENDNFNVTTHKEPDRDDAVVQTNTRKLLHVQPRKHRSLKLKKEHFCLLELSNLTKDHVAFMVKTTSSKYSAHPNIGIVLPSSTYEIAVKMQGQSKYKSDVQSEDKFLVHTFVSIPAAKVENISPEMFNEGRSSIEVCDMQVVQMSEQEIFIYHHAELLIKGFIACFLVLMSWYLMKQTLTLIGSLTMVIIMLMMKMLKKLVSESVEDWVVKTLIYIVTRLLFKRTENIQLS